MHGANSTSADTVRLEARLTLMAEMLQRAAEEARQLAAEVAAELSPEGTHETGETHNG